MDKKCFIIMPTSEPDGYSQGHFERVYQYIVIPACRQAGFRAIRANDPLVNTGPWDIVKNIVESEMVICDLSSKNANVVYGLAIRQAVNLPTTLIKDLRTPILFYIQDIELVEYDESLRIDTVQKEIEMLSGALTKSLANKAVANSILDRFNIGAAQPEETPSAPAEPEEPKKEESHLPVISPIPDYVGDAFTQPEEFDKLKVGGSIFHMNHGKGDILALTKMAKDRVAKIQFESGTKLLVLTTSGIFRKVNS